ncbi:MAG: helix-turn-helix domain-containing protein [Christensenellales bacterium]
MNSEAFITKRLEDTSISRLMFNYYLREFSENWAMEKAHLHDAVEIICCLEGMARFWMEKNNATVTLNKRELIIIRPNMRHKLYMTGDSKSKCVNIQLFSSAFQENGMDQNTFSFGLWGDEVYGDAGYLKVKDDEAISSCMKRIAIEMNNREEGYDVLAKSEITGLIIRLKRVIHRGRQYVGSEQNPYIQKALSYINTSLQNPIKPKDIADSIHVSAGYLMHLFKRHMGKSVMQVVTQRRVERGKHLLANTSLSVSEIASESGYLNIQHFSMVFKKATGISPTEFRKMSQSIRYREVLWTEE